MLPFSPGPLKRVLMVWSAVLFPQACDEFPVSLLELRSLYLQRASPGCWAQGRCGVPLWELALCLGASDSGPVLQTSQAVPLGCDNVVMDIYISFGQCVSAKASLVFFGAAWLSSSSFPTSDSSPAPKQLLPWKEILAFYSQSAFCKTSSSLHT